MIHAPTPLINLRAEITREFLQDDSACGLVRHRHDLLTCECGDHGRYFGVDEWNQGLHRRVALYTFILTANTNTPVLEGKAFTASKIGSVSSSAYYPTSASNLTTSVDTTNGYYGITFTLGKMHYSGWVEIDQNGTHISAYDYKQASSVASSAVPEPAAWALMILGLGATGAALRQRRKGVALAA